MERTIKSHNQQYIYNPLIKERLKLRNKVESLIAVPFAILGLIWFGLLIFYMIYGQDHSLKGASIIWILFQVELMLKIYLSPSANVYFKKNPAVAVSAIIPVVRVMQLYRYTIFFRGPKENMA